MNISTNPNDKILGCIEESNERQRYLWLNRCTDRLCVLLPLLLIEIDIWPFKIEFWALLFRFLRLWFLQGLPLSVLVVIGSLTFSDWCQRLPGWPGPQPSTLLWRVRCLSKHEAFSSSIFQPVLKFTALFIEFCTEVLDGLSLLSEGRQRESAVTQESTPLPTDFWPSFFMNFANVLQIFFKYLQCLHLSLLHCKDKLSCPVNTPCRNCAITHL